MLREDGQTGDYGPIVIMFISLIRNTGVKRLALAILIFLLIGSILNIAVAWGCVLWSPLSSPGVLADYPEYRAGVSGLPDDHAIMTARSSGFGIALFTFTWHVPAESHAIWHIRAGWPCEALAGQIDVEGEIAGALVMPRWLEGMVDKPERRPLPITPLAGGFAINTGLWALLLALLILGPGWMKRFNRKRSDRCIACGYDLSGAAHARCPECGGLVHADGVTVSSKSPDHSPVE